MSDKEILEKAMEKAIKNGLEINLSLSDFKEILEYNHHLTPVIYYWIIFSHEFTKAFWGENRIKCYNCSKEFVSVEEYFNHTEKSKCDLCDGYEDISGWIYHLQQMVIVKEPLKYLEKFV